MKRYIYSSGGRHWGENVLHSYCWDLNSFSYHMVFNIGSRASINGLWRSTHWSRWI
jgi:hypothetical protein